MAPRCHRNMPPDTSSRCPVIQPLPSSSNNPIAAPISSGNPTRPNAAAAGASDQSNLAGHGKYLMVAEQERLWVVVQAFMQWQVEAEDGAALRAGAHLHAPSMRQGYLVGDV